MGSPALHRHSNPLRRFPSHLPCSGPAPHPAWLAVGRLRAGRHPRPRTWHRRSLCRLPHRPLCRRTPLRHQLRLRRRPSLRRCRGRLRLPLHLHHRLRVRSRHPPLLRHLSLHQCQDRFRRHLRQPRPRQRHRPRCLLVRVFTRAVRSRRVTVPRALLPPPLRRWQAVSRFNTGHLSILRGFESCSWRSRRVTSARWALPCLCYAV